jgi:hypothetical protein
VALGAIEEDDAIDLEWDEEVDITPKEGPQVISPEVIGQPCRIATVNSVWENRERQDAWKSTVLTSGEAAAPAKANGKGKAKSKKAGKRKLR